MAWNVNGDLDSSPGVYGIDPPDDDDLAGMLADSLSNGHARDRERATVAGARSAVARLMDEDEGRAP